MPPRKIDEATQQNAALVEQASAAFVQRASAAGVWKTCAVTPVRCAG
ncbi:hypothetical protein [Paraburkholderia guartelaensis]|uniref:Uncharacterized protein n=1 Tax=Paraburkholderia guartelaensis TaxID=2546446 RepID=A0ABU9SK54_9BURK